MDTCSLPPPRCPLLAFVYVGHYYKWTTMLRLGIHAWFEYFAVLLAIFSPTLCEECWIVLAVSKSFNYYSPNSQPFSSLARPALYWFVRSPLLNHIWRFLIRLITQSPTVINWLMTFDVCVFYNCLTLFDFQHLIWSAHNIIETSRGLPRAPKSQNKARHGQRWPNGHCRHPPGSC